MHAYSVFVIKLSGVELFSDEIDQKGLKQKAEQLSHHSEHAK